MLIPNAPLNPVPVVQQNQLPKDKNPGKDKIEEGPAPKNMNGNTPNGVSVVLPPHGHGAPQVAEYTHVPNELKPVTLPPYVLGPPDILQIESLEGLLTQRVYGPHIIRPDGTVSVGAYGSAYVAGMTIDQAKVAIARVIHSRLDPGTKTLEAVIKGLDVDVLAYNTKVYYVITDRVGFGEIVVRLPITGSETVLDAISQINGLPPEAARRHICLARRNPDGRQDMVLPVDWIGITQKGLTATNYQILPGDRLYVRADRFITVNYVLSKVLAPFERILGVTLLGSQTVNSIKGNVP
jgi:polysaccharide export outer membrane protein